MKIAFRVVGDGSVIRHQTPAAGSVMGNRAGEVVLFTDEKAAFEEGVVRVVPDAVGKDLRDAFNIFNAKGIPVYAVGNGTVKRQSMGAGELLNSVKVCTLYCADKR
jgi:hypothetical protein